MQTVIFDKKKWLIGLDWEIIPVDDEDNKSRRELIKSISNKVDMSYGVFVEFDNQEAIGLSKKKARLPSASYYLALANQRSLVNNNNFDGNDWIVIEDVGSDRYWMGVINNGVPSPQFDKVLDLTSIRDYVIDLTLSNPEYVLFSKSSYIAQIFEDVKQVENKGVNELTEDVLKEKMKFEKLRGIPTVIIAVGATVVGVAALAMIGSSIYESRAMQQRIEERNRLQMMEREREEQDYQLKLSEYNKELSEKIKEAQENVVSGLSGRPSGILNAWYEAIGNSGVGTSGWTLTSIDCKFNYLEINSQDKSSCLLSLSRTGLSTNRMLLQEYPDAVISGNSAVVKRNIVADSSIYVKPDISILNTLPVSRDWGFDMLSQLQLMKIVDVDYKVLASDDIFVMPPLKPLSPSDIEQNIKQDPAIPLSIGISQGELIISGKSFDLLRELADNVDFAHVGVRGVNFSFSGSLGEIPWEVSLGYYLKSDNGNLVESDSYQMSNTSVEIEEEEK